MKFFWQDPEAWLFPDKLNDIKAGLKNPVFDAARGGIASIAFVLTGVTPGRKIELASDRPDCRFFEMVDVCVNRNTAEGNFAEREGNPKSKSVVRNAPFREFDALKPVGGSFVPKADAAAVYVQLPVKYTAKPGVVKVTVSVSDGDEIIEKSFSVRVSSVRLPETGEKSIFLTNWFNVGAMNFKQNVKYWTPRFWRALKNNAALMYHMRQNTFWCPLGLFFSYDEKTGKYTLAENHLKKYIDLFTDAGLYWIEGGHFGGRDGGWTATDFKVVLSGHSVKSIEGNRDIAQIAFALRDFMKKYGFTHRWIQHVTDEPIPCNGDSYRIFSGLVRKYLPGVPLLDAMSDPEIAGAPNIWCPQVQEYQSRHDDFEAMREQGDHIWAYTCCCPGGPYLNRLCDGELARPLLLGWGCGYYGIEGFLHWGWNFYQSYKKQEKGIDWQDPFEETSPREFGDSVNILPPGDTHISYPGPDGTVWGSMRLEAQREGMEDWELIRMLKKKDPAKCDAITKKVFRAFNDFTADPSAIRKARKALIDALEK